MICKYFEKSTYIIEQSAFLFDPIFGEKILELLLMMHQSLLLSIPTW